MKILKQYRTTLVVLGVMGLLFFFRRGLVLESLEITLSSTLTMIGILPPILLIVNLLDVWIPREIVIRHMGENAGLKGFFWAFFLGTLAAGPLYAAFPVAAMLAKKGAGLSYIVFLLGIWTTTKLPIFFYELSFFGLRFTLIHAATGILVFFILSLLMEKVLMKKRIGEVYRLLAEA